MTIFVVNCMSMICFTTDIFQIRLYRVWEVGPITIYRHFVFFDHCFSSNIKLSFSWFSETTPLVLTTRNHQSNATLSLTTSNSHVDHQVKWVPLTMQFKVGFITMTSFAFWNFFIFAVCFLSRNTCIMIMVVNLLCDHINM